MDWPIRTVKTQATPLVAPNYYPQAEEPPCRPATLNSVPEILGAKRRRSPLERTISRNQLCQREQPSV